MHKHVNFKSTLIPGLVASVLVLTGCGGGGGSTDDPLDSVSSRGIITGFGSVYVNGVKYDTDNAEFEVDDDVNASEAALSVGQFVTVYGSVDAGGTTGQASKVSYENEIKGPIANKTPDLVNPSTGTMEVLGLLILVNLDTRFDDELTFADFNDGDFAEISGFVTDTGITATYIEKQDSSEIEILGEIANLTDNTFDIRGVNIFYDGSTEIDDDAALADGLYVEVKGMLDPADNTVVIAEKIDVEDDGKGDDMDEFEIQGIVSNYDPDNNTFEVQGIKVDASSAELKPSSLDLGAPDLEVEVEGYWLDGVLIADEIEQKGQKIKINAITSAADATAGTVTFNFNDTDIVVRVNQQTEMEDDAGDSPLEPFGLSDLSETGGDYVEMEAYNDGSGDINAVKLDRKDLDETRIEAPVESFDEANQMVTLLGIGFDLSAASYEDEEDVSIDAATFYAALDIGVFVELKDTDNNLVIDKAELED